MPQPPRVVPVSQIIFRETDDGRVECAVIHRGGGLPLALARMLVAALGGVADVRDLGQQLSEGQTQAVSLLTIRDGNNQPIELSLVPLTKVRDVGTIH